MARGLNKCNIATMGGYVTAIFNALVVLDMDHMDWHLPSSYLKIFGAMVLPIFGGHITQMKSPNLNSKI